MTERVSLVEAYDNKDVVSQIYRIRETAQGAEDKSAEAVQKADAAVAVVPVVEAAVATANAASQAAQTAAGQVTDCVKKTGSAVPQVISGTGGLQLQGDLSVGGDLTVSADGHVHMDASDIEVANMAIEKSGLKTVLSNDNGIDAPDTIVGQLDQQIVNAKRLIEEINAKLDSYAAMVRTTGNQTIEGAKLFAIPTYSRPVSVSGSLGWRKVYEVRNTSSVAYSGIIDIVVSGEKYGKFICRFKANGRPTGQILVKDSTWTTEQIRLTRTSDNTFTIWVNDNRHLASIMMCRASNNANIINNFNIPDDYDTVYPEPAAPEYADVVTLE